MNIKGTNHRERLFGTDENDDVRGHGGGDLLSDRIGDQSSDKYHGGENNDYFMSHGGNDIMFGGSGDDAFQFEQCGANVIIHGGPGEDSLYLSVALFSSSDIPENIAGHHVIHFDNGTTLDVSGLEHFHWLT